MKNNNEKNKFKSTSSKPKLSNNNSHHYLKSSNLLIKQNTQPKTKYIVHQATSRTNYLNKTSNTNTNINSNIYNTQNNKKSNIKKKSSPNLPNIKITSNIKKKIKEFSHSIATPTIKDRNLLLLNASNKKNIKINNNNKSNPKEKILIKSIRDNKTETISTNIITTTSSNININNSNIYNNNFHENYSQTQKILSTPLISKKISYTSDLKVKTPNQRNIITKNYKSEINEIKNLNNPFLYDQSDEESLLIDDEKPINVLDYIARRLVASSFCGSFNLQNQKFNNLNSNIKNSNIENNDKINDNNENSNFKNLVSILNQKFKNFIHLNDLNKINNINSINANNNNLIKKNPRKKINKTSNRNFNISKKFKNEEQNINNMKNHYNKFLDISTNYDPGLDSRGDSSVERSLSLRSNDLKKFSFSPERSVYSYKEKKNSRLNSSFNKNSSSSYIKLSSNQIGIISEDEEYSLNNNHQKSKKGKNKRINYPFVEKKVTINLSMTIDNNGTINRRKLSNNSKI